MAKDLTLEFLVDIKGSVMVPPVHITQFLKHCEGRQGRCMLSWGLKKRTLKQNSYYKGIIVPMVTGYLNEQGAELEAAQVDLLIKKWVGFMRVDPFTSESVPRSTTELSTGEMYDFTSKVIATMATMWGIYIPQPDDNKWGDYYGGRT